MNWPTPEQIDAIGKLVLALAALILGYFQSVCRRDLDQAYAKIRELQGLGPGLCRKRFQMFRRPKNKVNIAQETSKKTDSGPG
jgi:hypothetical protein